MNSTLQINKESVNKRQNSKKTWHKQNVVNLTRKKVMIFKKEVEFHIDEITLKPGDTFTVWLDKEIFDCKRNATQVELRVTPDSKLEIFFDGDVEVKSFNEWKHL